MPDLIHGGEKGKCENCKQVELTLTTGRQMLKLIYVVFSTKFILVSGRKESNPPPFSVARKVSG